jgi:hypothetical protein
MWGYGVLYISFGKTIILVSRTGDRGFFILVEVKLLYWFRERGMGFLYIGCGKTIIVLG